MEIRLLGPKDAALLERTATGVFDDAVDRRLTREFLGDPRHHLCAAIEDGAIVGFASAVHYVHPDKAPELWINEVGVADSHHRKGIGRAVVERLLHHGGALGCAQAWVLTEQANAAARALYRSTGGSESGPIVMVSFDLPHDP